MTNKFLRLILAIAMLVSATFNADLTTVVQADELKAGDTFWEGDFEYQLVDNKGDVELINLVDEPAGSEKTIEEVDENSGTYDSGGTWVPTYKEQEFVYLDKLVVPATTRHDGIDYEVNEVYIKTNNGDSIKYKINDLVFAEGIKTIYRFGAEDKKITINKAELPKTLVGICEGSLSCETEIFPTEFALDWENEKTGVKLWDNSIILTQGVSPEEISSNTGAANVIQGNNLYYSWVTSGDYVYSLKNAGNEKTSKLLGLKSSPFPRPDGGETTKTEINIPEVVTKDGTDYLVTVISGNVNWYIHKYCSAPRNVILPRSLKRIEEGAFHGLGLDDIKLPGSLEYIGEAAFAENNLVDITIPASVKHIGEAAFWYNKLTNVTFETYNARIYKDAFRDNSLNLVNLNGGNKINLDGPSFDGSVRINMPNISGVAHVQNKGDANADGDIFDTEKPLTFGFGGQGLRLEQLSFFDRNELSSDIQVAANIQNIGDKGYKDGTIGTAGQSLRIESVRLKLKDGSELADKYDIYYSTYVEGIGWLAWAKNGEVAGSVNYGLRAEGVKVVLVPKGGEAPKALSNAKHSNLTIEDSKVTGIAHVQNKGNTAATGDIWNAGNPLTFGTTGQSLRVENMEILENGTRTKAISIAAHIQNVGDVDYQNGFAGTSGRGLRMEAVRLKLNGDLSDKYDIYYRGHVQNYGWLGWAKNGEAAGSQGKGLRIESVQVVIVPKGAGAPGSTDRPLIK